MQFDQKEGSIEDETKLDLENQCLKCGMSRPALKKLQPDLHNGDMTIDTLIECDMNDIKILAKEYNLTLLQTKSFIKAIKLLPGWKEKHENDINLKNMIYLTPKDQDIFHTLKNLNQTIKDFKTIEKETHDKNKQVSNSTISKFENYRKLLKNMIDEIIDQRVSDVCDSFQRSFFVAFGVKCWIF